MNMSNLEFGAWLKFQGFLRITKKKESPTKNTTNADDNKNDQPSSMEGKQNKDQDTTSNKNYPETSHRGNNGIMEDLNLSDPLAKGKGKLIEEVNTNILEPNIMKLAFNMSQLEENLSKESSSSDSMSEEY